MCKMSKEAVFTMKLESDLRAEFMAEAEAIHQPASQILRQLMRDFIQKQRAAREYESFLQTKVDASRTSMDNGEGMSDEEVEAQFSALRAKVAGRA
jgi:predicted transcriptional regulator